jgi:Mg2+ and Co2+ transporter CorA
LRNAAVPLLDVCQRLEHADVLPIDTSMQPHFRDVTDHVRRVKEEIDTLREVLAFAFEASLMTGQMTQTEITRQLAAWAAILAVPTAVAGIYGMNFKHMPELYGNTDISLWWQEFWPYASRCIRGSGGTSGCSEAAMRPPIAPRALMPHL